ncbi:co-chaperone GroES [Candidatus Xenohaliotis californiensis]
MALNIIPLHDRIVIETIGEEDVSLGGVFIPDTAKEKPIKGKVLYVGPGAAASDGKIIPLAVKRGDIVIYPKWIGTEVMLQGKKYLIVKESDILAIIEE